MTQDVLSIFDSSPVRLRYVASLRGITPADADAPFTYLQLGDFDPEELLCKALSNPTGNFFGIIKDKEVLKKTEARIEICGIPNLQLSDSETKDSSPKDFICYSSVDHVLSQEERDAVFALAKTCLAPNSIFCWQYKTGDDEAALLQLMIDKFVAELVPAKQEAFLEELRDLGDIYFTQHPEHLKALETAIKNKDPESFFETIKTKSTLASGSVDVMTGLISQGCAYVGDTHLAANYIELALSRAAQDSLESRQAHMFYELAKDFSLNRLVRSDVWVRMPATMSTDMPTLFNPFTFGILRSREDVPTQFETKSGTIIDLQTPLFTALIDLMVKLPLGVGDFMAHPTGQEFDADNVLSSIHILVAMGIAQPMKGRYELSIEGDAKIIPTKMVSDYLSFLTIDKSHVRVASPVVGNAIILTAKEALVLQAISRVGVSYSATSLLKELSDMAKNNPSLAATLLDATEPSEETADVILQNIIDDDVMRWYTYGLMAG